MNQKVLINWFILRIAECAYCRRKAEYFIPPEKRGDKVTYMRGTRKKDLLEKKRAKRFSARNSLRLDM